MATKGKVSVKVRNGNLDSSLKYFKKRVMESGILQEYKAKQEFLKPSVIKRRKKKESVWKQQIADKGNKLKNV